MKFITPHVQVEAFIRTLLKMGVTDWSNCTFFEKRDLMIFFRESIPVDMRVLNDQAALMCDREIWDCLNPMLNGKAAGELHTAIVRALCFHYGPIIQEEVFNKLVNMTENIEAA